MNKGSEFLTLNSNYEIIDMSQGVKAKYPSFLKPNFFKTLLQKYPFESFTQPLLINISPLFNGSIALVFSPDEEGNLKCFPVKSEDYTTLSGQSSVQYQLREPLSGIFALLPLLAENINNLNVEKAQSSLEGIYSKSYILLKNVNNITLCSKILSGHLPATDCFDFSSVIKSVAVGVSTIVKNITLHTEIDSDITLEGNMAIISNALINLISNSIHFVGDENPHINISLKYMGKNAIFVYSDNSKGIKDEILPYIFQPYFSKDPFCDSDIAPSLGLGLFIVKTAFEQAGGTIIVSSEFGSGVKFSVSFPVCHSPSQALESSPADFLLNKYSDLFVQLCDVCDTPMLR
ncbi:MAG: HAMP domain-containing sensor histidine kinase [Oscillospiraceae bacterium]